jgi:hypothetical protein
LCTPSSLPPSHQTLWRWINAATYIENIMMMKMMMMWMMFHLHSALVVIYIKIIITRSLQHSPKCTETLHTLLF